jgi:hypothetical protein
MTEYGIRRVTSKAASVNFHLGLTNLPTTLFRYLGKIPFERMNRHFGVTNTPTTFNRYLRRMPGFEGFWSSYRISSAVTSFNEANAASVHAVGWLERCDHGQSFRQLLVSQELAQLCSFRPAAASVRG